MDADKRRCENRGQISAFICVHRRLFYFVANSYKETLAHFPRFTSIQAPSKKQLMPPKLPSFPVFSPNSARSIRTYSHIIPFFFQGSDRRKLFHTNEKTRFFNLTHLFSLKNLPIRTGKSVASREFLGRVVGEQAVVPPDQREFLSGVMASQLVLY